ncbi:interferon gamma [Pelodytes ibericus]
MKYSTVLLFPIVVLNYFGQITGFSIDLRAAHKNIEGLRKYYNALDHDDNGDGVIFTPLLESWKEEGEKELLLSQIVPMYLKMLDSIKIANLQDDIKSIKNMLYVPNDELLKKSDQKLKGLNELKKIKMTDLKIQHTAIKELFPVLQAVSILEKSKHSTNKKQKREFQRRRRGSQNERLF